MNDNNSNQILNTEPSRRRFLKGAAATITGVACGIASGHSALGAPPPPGGKPGAAGGPAKAPYPPYLDAKFDDIVKDYEKLEGVLTIYRYKNDLYFEVTQTQLDTPTFLLQATRGTGTAGIGGTYGDPLGDLVFNFQKMNDQIYLVEPNNWFRASSDKAVAHSVDRSFADAYLNSFAIAAIKLSDSDTKKAAKISDKADKAAFMDKNAQSYLCSFGSFFLSDVTEFVAGMQGYNVDAGKSFLSSVKVFKNNMVVQSEYAFSGHPSPLAEAFGETSTLVDSRSIPETVVYNLWTLPDNGYVPRYYDDRIGFFTADYQTFDEDTSEDNIRRLIQRWNLKKKNPDAPVSEPVQPIVFWLDNGIPVRYRQALKEGVESWNHAFATIGYKNAVVCNTMPDDATWDTADMRYNVVRWLTSPGAGYAVALFRHNPFTGEIVNASINIDASMARFTNLEYTVDVSILASGMASANAGKPVSAKDIAMSIVNPDRPKVSPSRCSCDIGTQSIQHENFGWTSIELLGEETPASGQAVAVSLDDYTNSYLKGIVCHESGHCMGLRHNFRASTMLTMDQLQNADMVDRYTVTGSVMEYLPPNIAPIGGKQAAYHPTGPGPYDIWAIQYGYTDTAALSPDSEKAQLELIAGKDRQFGHRFASDEDADTIDPFITRFDLSSDPLAYGLAMLERGEKMLAVIGKKFPADGDPYYDLTRQFRRIYYQMANNVLSVSRFIGGIETTRTHMGDGGLTGNPPSLQPVPFSDQRRALSAICKYAYSGSAFDISPAFQSKLESNPAPYSDNSSLTATEPIGFSWLDEMSLYQAAGIYVVLNTYTCSLIEANEYRAGPNESPLTVLEAIQAVTGAAWSELGEPKEVPLRIPTLRRRLQRGYVDAMEEILNPSETAGTASARRRVRSVGGDTDADAPSFARYELRAVLAKIHAASARTADAVTSAHLQDTAQRISQILHPQMII